MKDEGLHPSNPVSKSAAASFSTPQPMNYSKQFGTLKRKLDLNDEPCIQASEKPIKDEFPSNLTQSISDSLFGSKDVEYSKGWKVMDKATKMYDDRHEEKCLDFLKPKVKKLEHRTSIRKLLEVNKNLQQPQRECMEQIGFGSFTRLELEQLDKVMLKWIVDRYEPEYRGLNIHCSTHYVKDEDVENAFGVPATGQTITLDASCNVGLQKYEGLFKINSGRIDIVALTERLKGCTGTGDEFKVMYLALLFGTILFPSTQQNLPVQYLNPLVALDKIKDLNWAELILEYLDDGIRKWKQDEHTYVCGCLTFLQVLFLAIIRPRKSSSYINLTTERPYLKFLTRERISSLTTEIQKSGGYWSSKAISLHHSKWPIHDLKAKDFTQKDQEGKIEVKPVDANVDREEPIPIPTEMSDRVRNLPKMQNYAEHEFLSTGLRKLISEQNDKSASRLSKGDVFQNPHVMKPTEDVRNGFCTRTEMALLSAKVTGIDNRVSGIEKQLTQLVTIMDELVSRDANRNQVRYESSCEKVIGEMAKLVQKLHNMESNITLTIINTISEVISGLDKPHLPPKVDVMCDNVVDEKATIDITLSDIQQSPKMVKSPVNPEAHEDEILQYLFDPNSDKSELVIDFGQWSCTRASLMCLKPCQYLNGSVIDCVSYVCTQKHRAEQFSHERWYFPAMFAQLCLMKDYSDENIIKMFFIGFEKFRSRSDDCDQIYIPINDMRMHWFLCIIDIGCKTISVCDPAPMADLQGHRRQIVDDVILRLETLIQKWQPSMKINNFFQQNRCKYMSPKWVPKQPNGYDCGLYVCLMMMFEHGMKRQLSDEESIDSRQLIAVELYKSTHNRFVWPTEDM